MENAKFTKNDNEFICEHCGEKVDKLGYTSRDHCNYCLYSKHVDINPGDRANDCGGLLEPIDVEVNSKKGYVIVYRCTKCKQIHKNIMAKDDNMDVVYNLMKNKAKNF